MIEGAGFSDIWLHFLHKLAQYWMEHPGLDDDVKSLYREAEAHLGEIKRDRDTSFPDLDWNSNELPKTVERFGRLMFYVARMDASIFIRDEIL